MSIAADILSALLWTQQKTRERIEQIEVGKRVMAQLREEFRHVSGEIHIAGIRVVWHPAVPADTYFLLPSAALIEQEPAQ